MSLEHGSVHYFLEMPSEGTLWESGRRRLSGMFGADDDNYSTSALKHCTNEFAPVFTDLFNASLHQHTVPDCFEAVTINHAPKKPKVKALNNYRPVAMTSVVMKVMKRLVLTYLKYVTNPNMDEIRFAYRENRCTDDDAALALHFVMQHLESPNRNARILFVDKSSAFNTVIPQKLFDKLHLLLLD